MQGEFKKMSLEQFKSGKGLVPAEFESLLSRINGGSFMECHTKIYEETGIWIPELVPVFEKLDTMLAVGNLPKGVQ
jgi:hypothetical protein